MADCYGNPLKHAEHEFLLPQLPEPGEVVINEILFNPVEGGADYVEIYNRSGKILDLKDLQLAGGGNDSPAAPGSNPSTGNNPPSAGIFIADSTTLFRPGEYRSEEHTSELQSLMRISYAVFCLTKKKTTLHN